MANSTGNPQPRKSPTKRPKKPYPDFPLSPHASGKWQKKIRGKIYYFGHWARVVKGKLTRIEGDGWKEALDLYKSQADDLHAGRTPRTSQEGVTLADVCNQFLTAKQRKVNEYKATTDRLIATFGKTRLVLDLAPSDFESLRGDLAKQWGPVRLGNEIQRVRTLFKYAASQRIISAPVHFGDEFRKPSISVLRRHRAAVGSKMLEADEIRRMIDTAGIPLKAMLLLAVNAGFGNSDCGRLPLDALDLDKGWVIFPRPKTGIQRRCPLWPETVSALRAAIAARPKPKEETGLVFITKYGRPWSLTSEISDAITLETGKLLRKLGIHRRGVGFYALRHSFRTVADAARDTPAARLIMGHADESIDATYRERIDDSRLLAVTEHVRAWLWPNPPASK
jgi:integrase